MSKRFLHLLSLTVGLLGLVACVIAMVATWSVHARVNQASENVFGIVDNSLIAVQQRVTETEDRVEALRITAGDIEASTQNWAKAEARERASAQLRLQEKAEHLASGIEQADQWLEFTESSVQLVQRSLKVGGSFGVPIQTDPTDRLLEELTSLREKLQEAIEPVNRIRDRASMPAENGADEGGLNQVVQLTVRVLATLSSIDSRFESLGERLTEIQTQTLASKTKAARWIRITAIGITLLIAWMAAGQGSLCFLGWQGLRREKSGNH